MNSYLQEQGKGGKLGNHLLAKVVSRQGTRTFTLATDKDRDCYERAAAMLADLTSRNPRLLPTEPAAKHGQRSCSNLIYGFTTWDSFFNRRQLLVLSTLATITRGVEQALRSHRHDEEYITAVCSLLAIVVGKQADYDSVFCRWVTGGFIGATFGGEAKIAMVWDYAEVNPFSGETGSYLSNLGWVLRVIKQLSQVQVHTASTAVVQGDAAKLPFPNAHAEAVAVHG